MKRTWFTTLSLGLLMMAVLTMPVLAQYNVTLRLIGPTGEVLYETTLEDVDNMTLAIPYPLWILINSTYDTTTFTTPFNITVLLFGKGTVILEVTSDPAGWTVTFEPMTIPDFNEDGEVDVFDMVKVARCMEIEIGPPENYNMFVDLNFDLTVDVFDLVQVAQHIGIVVNPPS